MPTADTSLAPQQKRSRETVERLLSAAVQLLDEFGLEGVVIPRIALAAKVSPASVYRRFVDKDALLRAAFLHMLQQSREANQKGLAKLLLRSNLTDTTQRLMALSFAQYRQHPNLLRALSRFMDTDTDQEFIAEVRAIVAANLKTIIDILLAYRDEIAHPLPKRALQIAVITAWSAIEGIALEPTSLWHVVQPLTDKKLANELTRGFVAYLRAPA